VAPRISRWFTVLAAIAVVAVVSSRAESPAVAAQTNSWSAIVGSGQDMSLTASTSCGDFSSSGAVSASYPTPSKILRDGSNIYVAGCFLNWAGVAEADYVAKWDGASWSGLGSNGSGNGAISGPVYDMTMYRGSLVVGGSFDNVGGVATADALASWNGTTWSGFATGSTSGCPCSPKSASGDFVSALTVDTKATVSAADDELIIGGKFLYGVNDGSSSSGFSLPNTNNVFKWTGTTYAPVAASSPFYDADANVRTRKLDFIPMDFQYVGTTLYMASARLSGSFASYSTVRDLALQRLTSAWESAGLIGADSPYGVGWGVTRLAAKDGKLYVGGNFTDAGNVASADYLAILDTSNDTWSNMHGAAVAFLTERGVHDITIVGSQIIVAIPGGSFGVQRWTGTRWVSVTSSNVMGVFHDEDYSGSNDRLLVSSIITDIGSVAAADYFAALALTGTSTLDNATSTNASPALSFTGATSHNINLPAASCSELLTVTTSDSGAGTAGSTYIEVAPGATVSRTVTVVSSDGSSTTDYTFNVTRGGSAVKPTAGTPIVSSVSATSANLSATVNMNGQSGSHYFEYSTNADMSSATPLSTSESSCSSTDASVTGSLSGLNGGTTYYVRLRATNPTGTESSAIASFNTPAPVPVVAAASSVGTTTATLNGTVNPNGTATKYYFEYGTSLSYGSRTKAPDYDGQPCFGDGGFGFNGSSPVAVPKEVTGLSPNTTYYFRLVACWAVGWPVVAKQTSALTFTTASTSTSTEGSSPSSSSPETSAPSPESSTTVPATSSTVASTESGTTTSTTTATAAPSTTTAAPTTSATATTSRPAAPTSGSGKPLAAPSSVASAIGKSISVKVTIAPTTKSVTAAGLPAGTKFNAKTGTITGKPLKKGTYSVTVSGVVSGKRVTVKVKITVK